MNYRKCGCISQHNQNTGYCNHDNPYYINRNVPNTASHCSSKTQNGHIAKERTANKGNGFLKSEAPLGMVYSPLQQWKELYDPQTALNRGTLFKELDLPFYPTPCNQKECHR